MWILKWIINWIKNICNDYRYTKNLKQFTNICESYGYIVIEENNYLNSFIVVRTKQFLCDELLSQKKQTCLLK